MDISGLFIRVVFLTIPGIITWKIYTQLICKRVRKDWEEFCDILIFSLVNYCILGFLIWLINYFKVGTIKFTIFQSFFYEEVSINVLDIVFASLIGILSAFVISWIRNNNVINIIGTRFKITNRFGEEDVWEHF